MKKTLKICEKPLITSECFTYYKMAIIQTIPDYETWLINRFKMFIDGDGDSIFGEIGDIYSLVSYSEILNIEEENVFNIGKDKIVSYIIRKINEEKYVMVDLNFEKLYSHHKGFELHETLIYGYDCDNQEFIMRGINNNTFKEWRVSFQKVEEAYEDVNNFFVSDKLQLLNRKRYFSGITLLSPKYDYRNINDEYELIYRLESEVLGYIYKRFDPDGQNEVTIYTGITCVKKLYDDLSDIISADNYDSKRIEKCLKLCLRISERENVLLHAVSAFFKKYSISDEDNVLEDFKKCYDMMYQNVLLFYKCRRKFDKEIIKRIAERVEKCFHMEKSIFESAAALIKKNFYSIYCLKNPLE